ncbi:MAG: type II secretion system minor pseudopilin GspH [Thioalkalivibrionaceae bacterium]
MNGANGIACRDAAVMRPRARAMGFTLLEVMIVVAIVGLLAGMATLSLSATAGREVDQAANRFEQVAMLVRDEAMLLGQPRAIGLALDGYAVLVMVEMDEGQRSWAPLESVIDEAGVLAAQTFTQSDVQMSASVGNRRVRLEPADRGFDRQLVQISGTGEFEPFELRFARRDGRHVVVVSVSDEADRLQRATVASEARR